MAGCVADDDVDGRRMGEMNKEKHKKRHRELHKYLDELVADWISHTKGMPSKNTVFELMKWSSKQIDNPDG